jgi:hypothetical protein
MTLETLLDLSCLVLEGFGCTVSENAGKSEDAIPRLKREMRNAEGNTGREC